MSDLLINRRDGVAVLMLDRPERRNALTTALLGDLAAALAALADEPACRVALIHGAGGHFAAGADIAEIEGKDRAAGAADPRKAHWTAIAMFPKPMIAAVDGFCLGGGMELALMADLVVVGETARLGLPETNLGLIPGAGGTQRLTARIGRARAARLIMTGDLIDASTAEAWGIAAYRVEGSALPFAEDLAAKLAARAPLALQAATRAIRRADESGLAFAAERAAFERLLDTADKREGISAFRDKRKPRFEGR